MTRHQPGKYRPLPAVLLLLLLFTQTATALTQQRGQQRVKVETLDGQSLELYSGSHALLIGVSDYTAGWSDLHSIPRELDQVSTALEQQGFKVHRAGKSDSAGIKQAIETFLRDYGYDENNRLLLFFSGHGHTDASGRRGYLVPSDAPLPGKDLKGFKRKALQMSQILAWSRQIDAKHLLFLFDSCFSGTVFKARAAPQQPPYITDATLRPVRQFITAGDAGEAVPARSTFTPLFGEAFAYHVVDGKKRLKYANGDLNRDGYLTGGELGMYLQTEVPKHVRQSPQYGKINDYELSRGDFVFVVAPQRNSPKRAARCSQHPNCRQ